MDRLREHLRSEGRFNQLFGRLRPALLLLFVASTFVPVEREYQLTVLLSWLGVFAALSIAQLLLRRQRMPVWTSKACMVVTGALILTLLAAWSMTSPVLLPFLIVLQPPMVIVAWALLKPLDLFLKRRVMSRAAARRRTMNDLTVIGIAGSVGKTTVKELIKHLLQDLKPLATPAHVNTEMGVANWMTSHESLVIGHEADNQRPVTNDNKKILIIEMGAYRKGEIKLLCKIAQPTIGVVTALGGDHIGLFGSEQAIVDANAELIEALPNDGMAYLNGDNDATRSVISRAPCPIYTVGYHSSDATLRAIDVEESDEGLHMRWHRTGQTTPHEHDKAFIPLHGKHNVTNILLAVAVAHHFEITDQRIVELLKTFRPLAHTFNVRTERGVTIVDDTYNASRLSFLAGLDWVARRPERPRVLLTAGLLELGKDEDRIMEEMGKKAQTSVERVIFTSKRGKAAFERGYGKPVELLAPKTPTTTKSSVLIALGRMPLSSIQRLLP